MGGKKSGGSSHTPVEAKETGRSFQQMRMLEVISEGEIHGLVDDMASVFLDNTPLQNADGTFNFKNVSVFANAGTQDQDVLKEFNSVEKEIELNQKLIKDKPLIRTVTDTNVTRVRMTLGVERLLQTKDNGDIVPTTVAMRVTVTKDNATFSRRDYTFDGKYSNAYREMFYIDVPEAPFSIKVERLTPDSTSNKLANNTFWSSYTEIIDQSFAYPNTALVGIKIDSEYFNSEPQRNYEIYGLMVKIPSNYDPFARTYSTTIWNGEFKVGWTNNPAWIFYDLVTNTRYGMGKRLADFGIDKWQLYAIARYCDELVPDGYGGREPRMTCNIWITDQRKAYDLLNDLCSVFRAMPVWNGQALTAIQDRVADPVWTFTNANVIGGFTRQRTSMKARHNTIQVEYIDGADSYEKKVESVSNDLMVARYGQNIKKVTAFGCTSRGQAYRTGRWILETERLETETITFTVGQEGLNIMPYDVFEVADNEYAGVTIGGRIVSSNGANVVLDRDIQIDDGSYLSYVSNNGTTESTKIVSYNANTKTVTLAKSVGTLPDKTVWGLSTKRITKGLYRAMSIKENDSGDSKTYTITALQHVPEKEDIVINGTHFDPKPQTIYGEAINADIVYNGETLSIKGVVNGNFNVLSSNTVAHYTVKLLKDGVLVYIEKNLKTPDIKLDNLENGSYEAVIFSYNEKGQLLKQYSKSFVIDRPPVVTGIEINGHLSSIFISWNGIADEITQTEIWSSETDDINTAKLVVKMKGSFYSHTIGAKKVRYYWLRHVRGVNNGLFDQVQGRKGESGVDLDAELEILNQKLSANIINDIIDTALPARKLGMLKSVDNLDVNVYAGADNVVNGADNTIYVWDGRKYIPSKQRLLAEAIEGVLQPHQLAQIPSTQIKGTLTSEQIQSLDATKLIGTINVDRIPSIPTNKLTGVLTDEQVQSLSATKITGNIAIDQVPNIPVTKLTGTLSANQISANSIGTNHLASNAVTADKILANAITADKIATNAVTAVKIQANAITSDKIDANAVTAQKIATDAIEANKIKAGAIIAGKLATDAVLANNIKAGAINADKLETGSVGTRALQALAITAEKIQANAITAEKIRANAINSEHISAGQISADKLAIGLGGNLLQNPIFANNAYGWNRYENTATGLQANNNVDINNATGVYQGNEYLPTENQYRWQPSFATYPTSDTRFGGIYQDVKLVADTWYILSGYVGSHRGVVGVSIEAKDGLTISNITRSYTGNGVNGSYNQGLKDTNRIWIKFKVTANGTARCIFNQYILANQSSNPFTVLRRPMLEECTQYATAPSSWVNAGVTSIHGGSIVTRTITAQEIATGTLTANEIAGGTITGNKIAGRTITADKLVTKSITANEINVSTLSVLSANLGTVTAGTIKGTTITGNTISGGTISGTTISGGTISGTTINGGTIKGVRLEGATGRFTGELEVSQLIGGGIIEQITGKLKYVTSYTTYVGQNYGENSSSRIYETSYIYEATVTIKPAPTRRYVEIVGVKSFVVEAHTSFSEKISKSFNSRSVGDQSLQFVVLAYTISTQKYISIS